MKQNGDLKEQSNYNSISHVAKIFTCLSDGINTLTEIARYCELSKPTVSRLLKALEKSNFVIYDPAHRKYYFGSLLNRLAVDPKTTHQNLVSTAIGEMNRLSAMFGETVVLAVLIGLQDIILRIIQSVYDVRVSGASDGPFTPSRLQRAGPLVLLSQLGPKELDMVLNNIKNNNINTPFAIDKDSLNQQLDKIKRQRYAINLSSNQPAYLGISVPINGYTFPASLAVIGIESRLESRIDQLKSEIITSGNRISDNLHSYHG
jgi:DNA-binding IclR family transcriptional regulator